MTGLDTGKSKHFFFANKKQKTYGFLGRAFPRSRSQVAKVFWFFFSKKNTLPSPTTINPKFILTLLAATTFATASQAGTVFDHVRAAGKLSCGAITEPGDDNKDDTHGNTEAFGEGICRAVAAARRWPGCWF